MERKDLLDRLGQSFFTIRWAGDCVEMIDQRKLPQALEIVSVRTVDEMVEAIRTMTVRGAPAIGIAGGMGVALSLLEAGRRSLDAEDYLARSASKLESARPTAVNLRWAVARVVRRWRETAGRSPEDRERAVIEEAETILLEDIDMCRRMGEHGAALIPDGSTVMTLCNAGALATGGHGTALSVLRAARRGGKTVRVVACETRPLLQGARLTAWELLRDGFDVTLICDSAAGFILRSEKIGAVVVGADRVARNGDCANKIGTYGLSVLAKAGAVPFYVVAPSSTLDPSTPDGSSIVIEERDPREVTHPAGVQVAPDGVKVRNPAFDVTPAANVTRIVTEKGVFAPADAVPESV